MKKFHDKSTITIDCNSRRRSAQFPDSRNFALSASGANRVVSFDLFSRVCHGDSITRSLARDIPSTACYSLSSVMVSLSLFPLFSSIPIFSPAPERRNVCVLSVPLFFFLPRAPFVVVVSREPRAGAVAPTIFAISRRAIFPARGAFRA